MKKIIIGLVAFTSISAFAQVQECLSVTRTLFAKGVICENQIEAVENDTSGSNATLKVLNTCLEKSDDTCFKSLSAGNKIQQAHYFERNLLANGVACQKQIEAVENDTSGSNTSLKALDKCLNEVFKTHLQILK